MVPAMHASMLRVQGLGRQNLQAPPLLQSTSLRRRPPLQTGSVMVSAVPREVTCFARRRSVIDWRLAVSSGSRTTFHTSD